MTKIITSIKNQNVPWWLWCTGAYGNCWRNPALEVTGTCCACDMIGCCNAANCAAWLGKITPAPYGNWGGKDWGCTEPGKYTLGAEAAAFPFPACNIWGGGGWLLGGCMVGGVADVGGWGVMFDVGVAAGGGGPPIWWGGCWFGWMFHPGAAPGGKLGLPESTGRIIIGGAPVTGTTMPCVFGIPCMPGGNITLFCGERSGWPATGRKIMRCHSRAIYLLHIKIPNMFL